MDWTSPGRGVGVGCCPARRVDGALFGGHANAIASAIANRERNIETSIVLSKDSGLFAFSRGRGAPRSSALRQLI